MEFWIDIGTLRQNILRLIILIKDIAAHPDKLVDQPKIKIGNFEGLGLPKFRIMIPGLNEIRAKRSQSVGQQAIFKAFDTRLISNLGLMSIFDFLGNL